MKRNLRRTIAALAAYDEAEAELLAMPGDTSRDDVIAALEHLEQLGRDVGTAYGLDTADINNVDTCTGVIRPGPKVPAAGYQLSFVRRMVEKLG